MAMIRLAASTFSATAGGLTVGAAMGIPLAWWSWGFSVGVGAGVGAAAGFLAGILAAADSSGRFDGCGQWVGSGGGIMVLGGLVAYSAAYGSGWEPPPAADSLYMAGAACFMGGVGLLCGRVGERIGRAVTDA